MLADLPEKELIARMGQAGKRLRRLARGEMLHLFQPAEPAFALEERMDLDTPVEVLDALFFVLNLMLEQLILRASARVLALASVTVTMTLEGGAAHCRTVRPALPKRYTPSEVAALLNVSYDTAVRRMQRMKGCVDMGTQTKRYKRGKRCCVSLANISWRTSETRPENRYKMPCIAIGRRPIPDLCGSEIDRETMRLVVFSEGYLLSAM